MRTSYRALLAIILCELMIFLPACSHKAKPFIPAPPGLKPLSKELLKSYLTLFKISPHLHFTQAQYNKMSNLLNHDQNSCVTRFKNEASRYHSELKHTQDDLQNQSTAISNGERHAMRCKVQSLASLSSQASVLANHAIPIAYQNRKAKMELIQQWPGQLQQIKQEIKSGAYLHRRWGDVKDIGFRTIVPGQKDDIKTGEEAVKRMKMSGMMPPVVKDPEITNYVNTVAQNVAAHSDLKVPLHVTVLNSKEINAFSFPGGYVFVERGLLQATDDEAELAGVLGHEIAHVVCRHGHQLMKQATIEGIIFQAAQVAAMVFTGGIAGIGTYYALQYGFYGLGLVLDLRLLGVSRKFELQADQLGMQYAWNAGYDPTGFIRFFDKMATKEGYVNGVGWFRTHPPFYTRMVDAEREIMFLPKKSSYIVNTTAFMKMKKELRKVTAKAKKTEKNRPSLYGYVRAKGCARPKKIEFKPNQPIEQLCTSEPAVTKQ